MKKNQHSIQTDKLKGVLITRTAIKALIPEDIVEKVIMFQFKDVKEATYIHEQIEVSGFGKFMTSPTKIRKRTEKLERALFNVKNKAIEKAHELKPEKLELLHRMAQKTQEILDYVKTKKGGYENKFKRDIGGSMELHIHKEGDRADSKPEE